MSAFVRALIPVSLALAAAGSASADPVSLGVFSETTTLTSVQPGTDVDITASIDQFGLDKVDPSSISATYSVEVAGTVSGTLDRPWVEVNAILVPFIAMFETLSISPSGSTGSGSVSAPSGSLFLFSTFEQGQIGAFTTEVIDDKSGTLNLTGTPFSGTGTTEISFGTFNLDPDVISIPLIGITPPTDFGDVGEFNGTITVSVEVFGTIIPAPATCTVLFVGILAARRRR